MKGTGKTGWTRDQLLVAFRLYCCTPFGKLHSRNPDIVALARLIGRTPSAVAMKACNFASLDPAQRERNIRALGNVSRADESLWRDFEADSETIAAEAETAYQHLAGGLAVALPDEEAIPLGPTEVDRTVRARRVQGFFRSAVLNTYGCRCALTDIAVPALLNASHIIPWSADERRRADPRNGLCLNVFHDRAFDRGLITFDTDWRLVLSPRVRLAQAPPVQRQILLEIEGTPLRLPERFKPDAEAMAFHREQVFHATA